MGSGRQPGQSIQRINPVPKENLSNRRSVDMSLSLEQLQIFQAKQLESRNDVEKTATPIKDHVIEWALVEIVILLTEIKDHLTKHRS
jgi:hypothetical protein